MGVDWFRQYLVIEFAEEGLDLLTATREMLDRNRSKMEEELHRDVIKGEREGEEAGDGGATDEQRGVDRESEGGEEAAAAVAPAAEGEGGRVAAAGVEAGAEAEGGGGGGEAGQEGEFDIRKSGKDLFGRFIQSGCGAECNLPGTIVSKVRRCSVGGLEMVAGDDLAMSRAFDSRQTAVSLTQRWMSAYIHTGCR